MKKLICLTLALLLLGAMLAGCGKQSAADSTTAAGAPAAEPTAAAPETTLPPETTPAPEEPADEHFNAEAFLQKLTADHPEANARELCEAMLEDPYFTLFTVESTEYYYPGLNYEYVPEGIREACCTVDYLSGSGALVYVFIPEAGTDAEALSKALTENAEPGWMAFENPLDKVESFVLDGKVFLAMYRSDMEPLTGPIADKPGDFVEMFHTWCAEHPDGTCLDAARYLAGHQKIASMDVYEVVEGPLAGFVDFESQDEIRITGFVEGAIFNPQIFPSTFIGYVFQLEEGADQEAFMSMLREKANLNWNVCVTAGAMFTEADGSLVLFMMGDE